MIMADAPMLRQEWQMDAWACDLSALSAFGIMPNVGALCMRAFSGSNQAPP